MPNEHDGSVVIDVSMNVGKAEKDLAKLKGKIEQTENDISDITKKRDEAKQDSFFQQGALDTEKAKLEEIKERIRQVKETVADKTEAPDVRQGFKEQLPGLQNELSEQRERVKLLQAEWNQTEKSVAKYENQLLNTGMKLEQQKNAAGKLADQIEEANIASGRFKSGIDETGKSIDKLKNRIFKLAKRALFFSIITMGLREIRTWLFNTIKSNDEAAKSIARLKGAFLTLAQPIVEVIIPAFTDIVNILSTVVSVIASFISVLFGTSAEESAEAAKKMYDEAQAISKVGNAAKKAKNQLAEFDEINKLTETGAQSGIIPDFSTIKQIPSFLKNILADMELKIKSLKISWDKKDFADKNLWIVALSGILGAVIGASFGGISGGIIGLLMGLSIGVLSLVFLDDTKKLTEENTSFIVVIGAILGTLLGAKFGGITGGIIGLLLGASISFVSLEFLKSDQFSTEEKKSGFYVTMAAILGLILGAKFGGITGAIIGLLLGVTIGLTSLAFEKAETGDWDSKNTYIIVLSAILFGILGAVFGGFTGAAIGLSLGAIIGFASIKFIEEGGYSKDEAIASFRIAIFAILGTIIGAWFGGPVGAGIGLAIGLTIGFASVAFDDTLEYKVRSVAEKALKVALSTIIGALIGAVFGGGVFGGIVGGVIGLTFGLSIAFGDTEIESTSKKAASGAISGVTSAITPREKMRTSPNIDIPGLAQGAVIPPNREFMAVLGDQKRGTNIETPLSTMVQAFRQAMAETGVGRNITVIMEVDKREFGRVVYKANNEETQRVGVRLTGARA